MEKVIEYPQSIEAFEIEQGINKPEAFPMCIEVAKRYNNYVKLVNALQKLHDEYRYNKIIEAMTQGATHKAAINFADEIAFVSDAKHLLQTMKKSEL